MHLTLRPSALWGTISNLALSVLFYDTKKGNSAVVTFNSRKNGNKIWGYNFKWFSSVYVQAWGKGQLSPVLGMASGLCSVLCTQRKA